MRWSVTLFAIALLPQLSQVASVQSPHKPEPVVFGEARPSVFMVETESGYGSGFLLHAGGLILTNDHVAGNGRYLAVGVDAQRKYPAVVVARDSVRDLVILRIHPAAVTGIRPLSIAATSATVGERVLAIGSALTEDGAVLTVGNVSRVGSDTVLADLNVNAGTSGGPLLNLAGDVLGICTFFTKAAAGPGLAGIVPGRFLVPLLETAIGSLTSPPPALERLPVASLVPYPAGALRTRSTTVPDLDSYGVTLPGIRVDVITPPVAYARAHQEEIKAAKTSGGRYAWQKFEGQVEAIVGIRVLPETRKASGSTRFVSDIVRVQLLRDGIEVQPIVPGRFCADASTPQQPQGCFALYQYLPESFRPGASLEMRVYSGDARREHRSTWTIPTALVSRIWSDFEPWFAGGK